MRTIAITKWNGSEADIGVEEFIRSYLYQLDHVETVARRHGSLNVYHHAYDALVKILTREFDDNYGMQQCSEVVNHG